MQPTDQGPNVGNRLAPPADDTSPEGKPDLLAGAREAQRDSAWSLNTLLVERQRILYGWSPAQLARIAHMDPRTVRSLVAGRKRPTLGTVQALCATLGLPVSDVIVFRDVPGGQAESGGVRS